MIIQIKFGNKLSIIASGNKDKKSKLKKFVNELIKEIKSDIEGENNQKYLDGELLEFVRNFNILGDNDSLF